MLNREEIENIVYKTFYELGYKEKFSEEYFSWFVDSIFKNIEWDKTNRDKSHSGKPHLSRLPHDLRTSDLGKLEERMDAIDSEIADLDELIGTEKWIQDEQNNVIDKLTKENEELTKIQDELVKDNYKINDKDMKLQQEALDSVNSIQDRFREELNGYELGQTIINGKPNTVYSEIMGLSEMFEDGGLINGNQAKALNNVAGKIVDFAYDETGGDDTAWSNRVIGIADDLRALSEKHDVNKNSLSEDLDMYQQNYNFIMQHAETKSKNRDRMDDATMIIADSMKEERSHQRMKDDFLGEKDRTQKRIDEVKKQRG